MLTWKGSSYCLFVLHCRSDVWASPLSSCRRGYVLSRRIAGWQHSSCCIPASVTVPFSVPRLRSCSRLTSRIHWPNAGLMLSQRRIRWINNKPALDWCIVIAGMSKRSANTLHWFNARSTSHSLGAMFQKAASFWVRLTQKVAKVWYVHMTRKYPWNINRVGLEVDRDSKVFEMRDAQGYPRATFLTPG